MKAIFLIIFLGVFVLGVIIYLDYQENNSIELLGIKISSKNFESITRPLPEGQYILCSLKENNCILMQKINLNG